jgi:hypothetical protein
MQRAVWSNVDELVLIAEVAPAFNLQFSPPRLGTI